MTLQVPFRGISRENIHFCGFLKKTYIANGKKMKVNSTKKFVKFLSNRYFFSLYISPLNPASRIFVRFLWSGKLNKFLCLCLGLGPAPRIFTKLLKILVPVLCRLNIPIIIYLDDMLLIGHTIKETLMVRDTLIFLQQLGFVLNLKKSG